MSQPKKCKVISIRDRKPSDPEYDIVARITGTRDGHGKTRWFVEVDGTGDNERAAGILERGAEVLRDNSNDVDGAA